MTRVILLSMLAASALAQTPPSAPTQTTTTIQGTLMRENTSEPIAEAKITLTLPAVTDVTQNLMNLAVSFGIPPAMLGEVREMIQEMMQSTPEEIRSEIESAKKGGAPPEFVGILTQVLASKAAAPGLPKHAVSDADGHFTFSNVPPGNYLVTAERDGFYGTSAQGTNSRSKIASKAVSVSDRPAELSLTMTAGARIQGRVVDARGLPLSDINVHAFVVAYQNGLPRLRSVADRMTDDRGEFRIFWLEPGDYYLGAVPTPSQKIGAVPSRPNVPISTFYPGSGTYQDSIRIAVNGGEELTGMEITMRSAPAVQISGQLLGLPASPDRPPSPRISLYDRNNPVSTEGPLLRLEPNLITPDGKFQIQNLPSGSYELAAELSFTRGPTRTTLRGRLPVEVRDRSIEGLNIALQGGVEIRGVVSVQGTPAPANNNPILVGLQPDGLTAEIDADVGDPKPIAADGSFSYSNMPEGDYRVRVMGMPPNAYVLDIRQNGASVYASGITISGEKQQPLEVTVRFDAGKVEGVAYTDQTVSPSTTVVLVPTGAADRLNGERYKITTADDQGRFRFDGVAPGQYKAFAWQNLPFGAHQNLTFISQYEAQGIAVDVMPSSTRTVRVTVIKN